MYTKGIPKEELVTLIELLDGRMITKIMLDELMEKYGDLVKGTEVIRPNEAREQMYLDYSD